MKSPDTIRKDLEAMCNRHGVEILYAFGSRAMELKHFFEGKGKLSSSTASDMDIGVKVRQPPPFLCRKKSG